MLKIGVIGYGGRGRGLLKDMQVFRIPYAVTALVDPRAQEIRTLNDPWLEGCTYFDTAEEMLAKADLDGILIATRCHMHADTACLAAQRKLPIFLEKPVAVTFEQVKKLAAAFRDYPAPTVVSFPLRLTPIVQKVRQLLEQDAIGRVDHVVAFNDVPYGRVYFNEWYRNADQTHGLWLQKATHDLDYLTYLVGQQPAWVFAANNRRVYGGDKPHDLRCRHCEEVKTCPESSWNLFYETFNYKEAGDKGSDWCVYSRDIKNEDSGNAILGFADGLQASYTQNFFARHKAERRGARLYGFKGTIEFCWYANQIKVYSHRMPTVDTIDFGSGMSHFGGDRELCYDFLMAMAEDRPTRSDIQAGITSALTCLWAKESSAKRQAFDVKMPV